MEFTFSAIELVDGLTMNFFVILFVVLVTVSGFPPLVKEGATCKSPEGKGVCVKIRNCPEAVEAVKQGLKPEKCGFIGEAVIVCCVKSRVSQERCKEFRKVYHPGIGNRILGGGKVKEGELPHMAAIGSFKKGRDREFKLLCTGTLISEQFVMTAAHCIMYMFPPEVVYLGNSISDLENNVDGLIDIDRENIIKYPLYKKSYHDIALLKLTMKVYPSELMVPACLYSMDDDPAGPLFVAGWGATNALGTRFSPEVLVGSVRSNGVAECENKYKKMFGSGINSSLICAGDPTGRIDSCSGDSGGPLMTMEKSGYYTIFGITSVGPTPCGGVSSVYIRVSAYIDWIEQIVWSSA